MIGYCIYIGLHVLYCEEHKMQLRGVSTRHALIVGHMEWDSPTKYLHEGQKN